MAETKPPVPAGEIGSSGLRQWNGYLAEEFDRKLQGPKGMEVFRAMRENSPAAGAALHAIEMVVRQVETEVVPFSADADDMERAEFLKTCLHDMSFSWAETMSEHITMLPYGFALHEVVYKARKGYSESGTASSRYSDGRIGWAKIPLRGQESISRWNLDEHGGIRGAWQQAAPDYVERYLPISRCLLFRVTKERNNPEGRSLLRSAYWPYYCGKRLTEIMLIGTERDLAGLPVVRVPSELMAATATDAEKAVFAAYKDIARNIRRGEQEGVVLPSDRPAGGQHYFYDLQLLASGGKREFAVAALVQQYDRWIATVLLSDLLLMGHEAVGSYALSESKAGLFETALDGYLATIDATYNQHAVPRLMQLNGWPADRCPRIKHRSLKPENLAALADFLQKLQGAGMPLFPDPALEESIRRRAGLPARSAEGPPAPASASQVEEEAADDADAAEEAA